MQELADRIEDALRKEATKYRQVAQVAYADVAEPWLMPSNSSNLFRFLKSAYDQPM